MWEEQVAAGEVEASPAADAPEAFPEGGAASGGSPVADAVSEGFPAAAGAVPLEGVPAQAGEAPSAVTPRGPALRPDP